MIQLQIPGLTPSATDSIVSSASEVGALRNMTLDDFLAKSINAVVTFAIHLAVAVLVFYIGRMIINKLYKVVHGVFMRRQVDASLSTFVLSMVRIVLYFILIVTVIGILGLETSSFLAIFASAGVAIGMALSGTLQNFAGGVLILLLKPYKVGQYIEAQGYAGTVREIQIFHTIITTPDNKSIIIPNGGLSTGSINNYSREDYRRVDWLIGISYGDSFDTARAAIESIVLADSRVIKDNPDRQLKIVLNELADSSVNIKISAWTASSDYWPLFYDINERLYSELPKAGISFPFPQLDVHLQNQ